MANYTIPSLKTNPDARDFSNIDVPTPLSMEKHTNINQTMVMDNGKIPSPVYSNETTYKAHNHYVMNAQKPPTYGPNYNHKNTGQMQTNPFSINNNVNNKNLPTKN